MGRGKYAAAAVVATSLGCSNVEEPPGRAAPGETPSLGLELPSTAEVALAAPEPNDDDREPGHGAKLVAIAMMTWVHKDPDHRSPTIGYLRAGMAVDRARAPAGSRACSGGWYAIAPRGFVCIGRAASLDLDHPIAQVAGRGARRRDAHPYTYVMSRKPPPHLYARVPTEDEQRHVEGREAAAPWDAANRTALGEPEPLPELLAHGGDLPKPYGAEEKVRFPTHRGRARPDSAFGLLATYDGAGRRWGLTTELDLIPLDRTRTIRQSNVRGVEIKEGGVPAFVVAPGSRKLVASDDDAELQPVDMAARRSAWALTGRTRGDCVEARPDDATNVAAARPCFRETEDGVWLASDHLRTAKLRRDLWGRAEQGRKWIDVSITQQILVAYEGQRPVYGALVSTGRGELGDPETTAATVRGTFFIEHKHLTATMDGDAADISAFDLRDVPYVQYFHNNFAFHGAYWHDEFGKVRSNGCVNLAPADAAWLFEWTDPVLPAGWHGVHAAGADPRAGSRTPAPSSTREGTLVYIHE